MSKEKKEISSRQRDAIAIFVIIFILAIFLVPIPKHYEDSQVRTYTALLYKFILWPQPQPGQTEMSYKVRFHFFPNNFHELGYYVQFG